ncbi:hypothetical protein ILYODFUR_002328 [Ilyodon furcidens]|uniref:Uncharacterized protein n=1 Tax=Ilyodon furcidens TaxID=33524 RepID=A0ABV0TFF0_9TELE
MRAAAVNRSDCKGQRDHSYTEFKSECIKFLDNSPDVLPGEVIYKLQGFLYSPSDPPIPSWWHPSPAVTAVHAGHQSITGSTTLERE